MFVFIGGGCDGDLICSGGKRASGIGIPGVPRSSLLGNAAPVSSARDRRPDDHARRSQSFHRLSRAIARAYRGGYPLFDEAGQARFWWEESRPVVIGPARSIRTRFSSSVGKLRDFTQQ
jgi:hypothetical protein